MPVINRVSALAGDVAAWRQDFHQHPELLYDVHRTAGIVADKLRAFGCDEVATGIGRTGVVGVIRGRGRGGIKAIGLRADMDALPIHELTDLPYASKTPGKMHACGHDGHTAMLLGAARYLCETRNFDGEAVVIFQPAEEGGSGGKAMLDDGLVARFGLSEVYGMHIMPGLPVGRFATRAGPIMASADRFEIVVTGRGGHAAWPHLNIDPVVIGAQMVGALQTIVSRGVDPLQACVVSVTQFHAGEAFNVIPQTARLGGTVRALDPQVRSFALERIEAIAAGIAAVHQAEAAVEIEEGYPVTVNEAQSTAFAAEVAREIAGEANVESDQPPMMGAEDFAFMLGALPGAYILVGNGDSATLHHPNFDFNDEAAPHGMSYWARLIEKRLAA